MLSILSYVYGPLHVLLREVSGQVLCPFLNWIVCIPDVESYDLFMYFGAQTLVPGIIDKYVFPYNLFPFHFVDVFFNDAETF